MASKRRKPTVYKRKTTSSRKSKPKKMKPKFSKKQMSDYVLAVRAKRQDGEE